MEEKRLEFREAIHKTLVEIWRPRCAGRPAPPIPMQLCIVAGGCDDCPLQQFHGPSESGHCIPQYHKWALEASFGSEALLEAREMVLALAKLLPYKERVAYKSWGKVVVK